MGLDGCVTMNLPNVVTLGRIILVPVIFWLLLNGNHKAAFIAFVCAGISDAADGFLAKRLHLQTELGAYLDPMADKLLIVSVYIALGVAAKLPSWLVIAVVSRDILIVVAVLLAWVVGRPLQIKPILVSKANTLAQILLAALVLADDGFGLGIGLPREALVWITGTLTLTSLAFYLREWVAHFANAVPTNRAG